MSFDVFTWNSDFPLEYYTCSKNVAQSIFKRFFDLFSKQVDCIHIEFMHFFKIKSIRIHFRKFIFYDCIRSLAIHVDKRLFSVNNIHVSAKYIYMASFSFIYPQGKVNQINGRWQNVSLDKKFKINKKTLFQWRICKFGLNAGFWNNWRR